MKMKNVGESTSASGCHYPRSLPATSSQELMVLDTVSLKGHPWLDWLDILA